MNRTVRFGQGLPRLGWLSWLGLCLCASTCPALQGVPAQSVPAQGMPEQAASSQTASAKDTPTKEILQLFNGMDLSGFEAELPYWSVVDGAIVGQIPQGQTLDHNTWLVYKARSFGDFDLTFEFQMSGLPGANSGVQFRSQVESPLRVNGYQADIDMGATWLGRIYDEHGRELLVERGTRVELDASGKRSVQVLAPAASYGVLFRENEWNEYRIVAIGHRLSIWINGTLFCELMDRQEGEYDREGSLAWQLHSGPETTLKFRKLQLEVLSPEDDRLGPWKLQQNPQPANGPPDGIEPVDTDGQPLNLSFETGTLEHWQATGNAFDGQPVAQDGISQRWPDQQSNKVGDHFIGGYELVADRGTGTLTSDWFTITHPYGSFLVGGGQDRSTRVELHLLEASGQTEVLHTASGTNREAMRREVIDLQPFLGRSMRVQLVDENPGAWGHLNFDDFRFHADRPQWEATSSAWRSTANPILQHLVINPRQHVTHDEAALATVQQMYVPEGFSVDVVAAEPRLHQPMAFAFDGRGRIWVVEGHCYPERRPEGQGLDRVLIFSDTDGDGHFETRTVFCENLNLVSALEVGYGGVWIGAAPQLLFIPDRDQNDQPDGPPMVLLDGFGFADTHETLNNFCWGPDGWLYGNQGVFNQSRIGAPGCADEDRKELSAGVFRYHPTSKRFEVFAHGGSNQWGLDFDQQGHLFMTHCRSFWGGGSTTHVLPGGHYWNQVNSGYADFISAEPLDVQPAMKNYLLASARYDHGEGGAGKPGSNVVYGGHSHVGTMIYLGNNWPQPYRHRLFTHNLHGHQINQQINRREQGGFHTVHAGQDVLFCADPQYIGVALKYGPDGAVYLSDWYDPRHCHSPNVEQWDRGNGRLYRMQFDASYQPVAVSLPSASDLELVAMLFHENEWFVRMSRMELAHRATQRSLDAVALQQLQNEFETSRDALVRLRSLWVLNAIGKFDEGVQARALRDEDESVRGWAVRLAVDPCPTDPLVVSPASWDRVLKLARQETSMLVKRELASAAQRLPADRAWALLTELATQNSIDSDRPFICLLWYAMAGLVKSDPATGLQLSDRTGSAYLRDYIRWYAARISDPGRADLIARIIAAKDHKPDSEPRVGSGEDRYHLVRILEHALAGTGGVPLPESWKSVSAELYSSSDPALRRASEQIGSQFRDPALFERARRQLLDSNSSETALASALEILQHDASPDLLPLLLDLLDRPQLIHRLLPLLRRFDDLQVAQALIPRLSNWESANQSVALEILSSRPRWASQLLDAIERGELSKQLLTAFHVHQMIALGDPEIGLRLESSWGKARSSSQELREQIQRLSQSYSAAPLWAYDAAAGKQHFEKLCASCHQDPDRNSPIAPQLGGSGAKGITYLVENVIDPNAVIGRDYQARLILTNEGRVITGLVVQETATAITIRTASDTETLPREEIEEIKISDKSFMPEGLIQTLDERQTIELFKYLMSL